MVVCSGGVHDICSDKTGTITVGRMIVKKVWIPVNAAFVPAGKRADYDIDRGQTYTVESGRE
jgi:Na+-exporting ATPase